MNEYKEIIYKAFPNYLIDSAYDYGKIIVFNLLPKDFVKRDDDESPLNRSFSVNKKTKEINAFFPFDIDLETYQKGKRII